MTNVIKIVFIVAEIYNTNNFLNKRFLVEYPFYLKFRLIASFNTEMEQKSLAVYGSNGFSFSLSMPL